MRKAHCGHSDGTEALGRDLLVHAGPSLSVDIGLDANYRPSAGAPLPDLELKGLHALIDTGARDNCIDRGVVMQLGLPLVDRARVSGVFGVQETNVYMAQVAIPALSLLLYGNFLAVDLIAGGQPHAALLGRSFLRHFVMQYDGRTGEVVVRDAWVPDDFDYPIVI